MNKFFAKILGFEKINAARARAEAELKAAEDAANAAKEAVRLTGLSPKELATEKKEPWVDVLSTHVNKDNIRNGFFELDWNEYFVQQLRLSGYQGDTEEAVVDAWFSELCRNVGSEVGVDMSRRGTGYINTNNLGNGKTEVS